MYLGQNLILILSLPRSGSTMLQRILGSHTKVLTHPEPHILTPLAFQGYFYQVEKASYNHKVAAQAFREFVDYLPDKEEDYLNACRAYCEVLYSRALENSGKHYFLDKTPNYADTILPFIKRLLPKAKFIVLTRHPLAILSSDAHTFYNGDYDKAYFNRDLLGTFIQPIARFLKDSNVMHVHIKYEDLVSNPELHVRRLLTYLNLDYQDGCIHFGEYPHITKTYGDPKIGQHTRPVALSLDSWVKDFMHRPDRRRLCKMIIDKVQPEDLATYGYPTGTLWKPLEDAMRRGDVKGEGSSLSIRMNALKWRLIRSIQSLAHRPPIARLVKRLCQYCDALMK